MDSVYLLYSTSSHGVMRFRSLELRGAMVERALVHFWRLFDFRTLCREHYTCNIE